jgi:drug/metabolite transporter (DMT)-like permease
MLPDYWIERLIDLALSPALWLSALLVVICALLFTLWRGGGWRQGVRDLIAAALGFLAGQLVASFLGLDLLRMGDVQLLFGTMGAVAALAAGRFLPRSRLLPGA